VLVIGAENLSRWVDWSDRNMAVLLADGAGATVLEYDPTENDLLSFSLGADGADADLLTCEHGGYFQMDGAAVFRRAVRVVVDSAEKALEMAGITADDLSLVIPHQAKSVLSKRPVNGSTSDGPGRGRPRSLRQHPSSASIPLAFDRREKDTTVSTRATTPC